MRKLLITCLTVFCMYSYSQNTFEKLRPFISVGFDPKMALVGAGHDWGDTSSLDYEVRVGVFSTQDKIRISHAYKSHKRIGFQKWTYLQVDKEVDLNRSNTLRVYAGLELSAITRESFTYHYSKPDDYRRYKTNIIRRGANLEFNYRPKNSYFSLFARGTMYQSETDLQKYKKFRKDFTVGVFFHFYKH